MLLLFAHTSYNYCTNRLMSFDLEISSTQHNGSCYPINEGSVVLSYRIGTSRQWKIVEEYSSVGKQELCS